MWQAAMVSWFVKFQGPFQQTMNPGEGDGSSGIPARSAGGPRLAAAV